LKAYCQIRESPLYRREVFLTGLMKAGYQLHTNIHNVSNRDVLVIWNRYWNSHELASQFEKAGGRVIVAENGYLGAGGTSPKFDIVKGPQPHHYFALSVHGHNGRGTWPDGGPERFDKLRVVLHPFRDGEHVVVAPNRPFGQPGSIMPSDWGPLTVKVLEKLTKRRVVLRSHPGNDLPPRPLVADLAGAHAMVIWNSTAGIHALQAGVKVISMAPNWIMRMGALFELADVDKPLPTSVDELRLAAFRRMAWAQWTAEEISTGEPFRRLLE
jgi:hypothetical protein